VGISQRGLTEITGGSRDGAPGVSPRGGFLKVSPKNGLNIVPKGWFPKGVP
jgi:hypothetical protein